MSISRLREKEVLEAYSIERIRRPVILRRLLEELCRASDVPGVAVVAPHPTGTLPEGFEYLGERAPERRSWLRSHLDAGQGGPGSPSGPQTVALGAGAKLLLWPRGGDAELPVDGRLARGELSLLGALLELEVREETLEEGVSESLQAGDPEALSRLLALVREVGGADLAYWGGVHDRVVDVEWSLGARQRDFGFELPLGEGVGGRAFAGGEPVEIPDYLNCRYRYPGVSDMTDGEEARSTLAIPVRGLRPESGGVLYAVRRSVEPFSGVDRALLRGLAHDLEPLSGPRAGSRRFFFAGTQPGSRKSRERLRRLLLQSSRPEELKEWIEAETGGPAVLLDRSGRPYVPSDATRLDGLLAEDPARRVVPLPGRGSLVLRPAAELPPEGWPDLLEDVAAAASVVLERAERAYERFERGRVRWLRDLLESPAPPGPELRREGRRLGLPTDSGEVWALAWRPEAEGPAGETRLRMLAEDVLLDRLQSPLICPEPGLGAVFLSRPPGTGPAAVRDELLRSFGPAPLWLVHGAGYGSLPDLKSALKRALDVARSARVESSDRYVLEVCGRGLEGLLDNPRLAKDLEAFSESALDGLLEHDRKTGSDLTTTFCVALTEGPQAASKKLFVHPNTVRYRLRRAEDLLKRDLSSPRDRTALSLAAFVYLRRSSGSPL